MEQGSSSSAPYHGGTKEQQHMQRIREGISHMRKYELPSTQDTVKGLEHIKTSDTHKEIESTVSPTGKRLVEDVDRVVSVAQKLLQEKNEGDHFQQMLLHAKKATDMTNRETLKSMKGQGGQLTYNMSFTYQSFVDIVKMLVSSSEFRTAIKGLVSALMDIFKYNMGDTTLNTNIMKDSRDEFSSVARGEQSGRDAAHHVIDSISDTMNAVVPDRVREDVSSSVQPHMDDAATGEKRKREALGSAARDSYHAVKQRAYKMEVPEEYKDALITRLKDSLVAFQKRPEFQKALDNFFNGVSNLFESSRDYSKDQLNKGKMVLRQSEAENEWKIAFEHAQKLIENIFNGNSLTEVVQSIKVFTKDIQNDDHLLAWFQGWKNFIHAILRKPEYVESDTFRTEAKILAEQTGELVSDRYRSHANEVFDYLKNFMSGAGEDPTNREFMDALRQLWSDACLDDNGNLTLKRELLKDMSRVMSTLSQKMAFIPLPRVEYDDADMYFLMDNVVLNCSGIIPTHMEMDISVRTDLSIPELVSYLTMKVSQIQISAHNVDFSIRKKTGFPKITETGHMDFSIYGDGLSTELTFVPYIESTKDGVNKGLDLERCNVNIGSLDIHIYDTERHRLRYKLFKGMIQKIAKRQISRMISENLAKLVDPHGRADVNQMKKSASQASDNLNVSMPSGSSPSSSSSQSTPSSSTNMHNNNMHNNNMHNNTHTRSPSRSFNSSGGTNQWVNSDSKNDISPVVQKWANNESVYSGTQTQPQQNDGLAGNTANSDNLQQADMSLSGNDSQGVARGGVTSKMRDGLKMFRHAEDSSVVKR